MCYQRSALASLNVKVSNQQFEINRLKAENDRLREALKFYAEEKHFKQTIYGVNPPNCCWYEGNVEDGTTALEALNGESEEK